MSETKLPGHLMPTSEESWAIWRWVGLRGAGFPLTQVLTLAEPQCVELADAYLQQHELVQRTQAEAIECLWQKYQKATPLEQALLRKASQQLSKGQLPSEPWETDETVILAQLRDAKAQKNELQIKFQATFQQAIMQNTRALRKVANDSRFREAVLWQNRQAVENGLDQLLKISPIVTQRAHPQRRHEAIVASYLQRYCTKNDTIGFFGPVGWARWADQPTAIKVQTSSAFLASNDVFFEGWGIDIFAQVLSQNEALLPWCAPRRLPLLTLDGLTLHVPLNSPRQLTPAQASVLKHCDGIRLANQIVGQVIIEPASGLHTEAEVYAVLKDLQTHHYIAWAWEIPVEILEPLQYIKNQLERITDTALSATPLDMLHQLDSACSLVKAAVNDVQLSYALRALDDTFLRLTQTAPTRYAGQTYAGRTLVYQDCRRQTTLTIGPKLLDSLHSPLSLLLTSARWFTIKAVELYRQALKELYQKLSVETNSPIVRFPTFWLHTQAFLNNEGARLLTALERGLQKRWATLLNLSEQPRHIHYTARDLKAKVPEAFPNPKKQRSVFPYYSPDLMIAATNTDEIEKGNYHWVLGELHPATNTLVAGGWVAQHPNPAELYQGLFADHPSPQVKLAASRAQVTARRATTLAKPTDYRLMVTNDACGAPWGQNLAAGDLVVEESGGELVVRGHTGQPCFEIIEFLSTIVMLDILHRFHFLPALRHLPRISIDQLIIQRETWNFTAAEMAFAFVKEDSDRFLQMRSWAQAAGLPRFLFVKTPFEAKPFFVDLASPISIEALAKTVRQVKETEASAANIRVTEMLPTPEQAWLEDSVGRCVSELRMVVVDQTSLHK